MLPAAKKYLAQYAEPLIRETAAQLNGCFDVNKTHYSHALVIPAYNESTAFIRRLVQQNFHDCKKILVIIVINQPCNRHKTITRLNQRLWDYINTLAPTDTYENSIYKLTRLTAAQCDFLCVNQCNPGTPEKQGVGYARKFGCDIAIELIAKGCILPSWLHCTDADASLPNNYFNAPPANNQYSALNYAFSHRFFETTKSESQKKTESANQLYEKSILYYRNGLAYAGSHYAFTTLGSAMAIQPNYYCLVRGFPKRAGGEDFYLLNKLTKLAPVYAMAQTIHLKPRASLRVPFGTGPAVYALLKNSIHLDFNPQVFVHLKEWLDFLSELHNRILTTPENPLITLNTTTQYALNSIKIQVLFEHIKKQSKSGIQTERMAHDWFDGFKTLKFIHALTRQKYPKMELLQLQKIALFNTLFDSQPTE